MKVRVMVFLLLIGLASSAFGAAITKSTAAEFSASGAVFTDTEVSGDTVVLTYGPEALWTANGVRVNQSAGSVVDEADMDTDGSGGAFVAWRDTRKDSVDGDIYLARVDTTGSLVWEKRVTIGGEQSEPKVVASSTDGTCDGAIVVYVNADAGGGNEDIYAQKYNLNGDEVWPAPVEVCGAANTQDQPQAVSDDAGGAVAVWRDYRGTNGGILTAIYAQRIDSGGNKMWQVAADGVAVCNSSATEPDDPLIVAIRESSNDEGYMISWMDDRDGFDNVWISRIESDGDLDTPHYGDNGIEVSTSGVKKDNQRLVHSLTYNGAIVAWNEGEESVRDIYAQRIQPDGTRVWGNTGVALSTASGQQSNVWPAALPQGEAYFSWIDDLGSGDYDDYIQKLNASGTAQFAAGGIDVGYPLLWGLAYDGSGGVYGGGMAGTTLSTLIPYAQRFDGSGNELWGAGGVQLSSDYSVASDFPVQLVACEDRGAIVSWHVQSNGAKDVYVQKVTELYAASGYYTTEKIENTDYFYSWDTIEWESSGTDGITAQVRTGASEADLDGREWVAVTDGGSIPNNGPWIQARFKFDSPADRLGTPALDSVSFNYSTTSPDTTNPVIESVKIGGVDLDPTGVNPVGADPLVNAVLTDDQGIGSAAITLDGSDAAGYTILSSTDTRWEIQAQPDVTVGSHTLVIRGRDKYNNQTSAAYNIFRSTEVGITGAVVAGVTESENDVEITYNLQSPVAVTVEIRDIKGNPIRRRAYTADELGGAAGSNTVAIDISDLPNGVYFVIIHPTGGNPIKTKFAIGL